MKKFLTKRKFAAAFLSLALSVPAIAAEYTDYVNGIVYDVSFGDDGKSGRGMALSTVPGVADVVVVDKFTMSFDKKTYNIVVDRELGSVFEENTHIRTVTLQKREDGEDWKMYSFRDCPNLQRVNGLPELDRLEDYFFLNCPEIDFNNLSEWLPKTVTSIGSGAFALDNEQHPSGNIVVPAAWTDVAWNAFAGRHFFSVTYEYAPGALGLELSGRDFVIERAGCRAIIDDRVKTITNRSHPITEIFGNYESSPTSLERITVNNMIGGAFSLDAVNPVVLDFAGSTTDDFEVSGTVTSLVCPRETKNLRLHDTGIAEFTLPRKIAGWIDIRDAGSISSLDLSQTTVKNADNSEATSITVNNCASVVSITTPDDYEGTVEVWGCPNLKDLRIGPRISDINFGNNGQFDFTFGGNLSEWINLVKDKDPHLMQNSIWNGDYDLSTPLADVNKFYLGQKAETNVLRDVTIPSGVFSVNANMFAGCKSIESVNIPSHVKFVDDCSFVDCTSLKKITLNCDSVGPLLFCNDMGIEHIELGSNIKAFVATAFSRCGNPEVTTANYNGTPTQWAKIQHLNIYWFDHGMRTEVFWHSRYAPTDFADFTFNGKHYDNIIFDEYLPYIPKSKFYGLKSLGGVYFADDFPTKIDDYAFANCRLKIIGLQNNMDKASLCADNGTTEVVVGEYAFSDNPQLGRVDFLDNIAEFGNGAFDNTPVIANAVADADEGVVYIGKVALSFKGPMAANTVLKFKEGTRSIASRAFAGQKNLTGVEFPDGMKSIGENAFSSCTNLGGTLRFPSTLERMQSTFESDGITSLIIEDGKTPFEAFASLYLTGLTDVYFGRAQNDPYSKCFCLGSDKIKKITLGPNFDVVQTGFLTYGLTSNLESLVVLNPEPPQVGGFAAVVEDGGFSYYNHALESIDHTKVKLFVPDNSIEAYKTADRWKDFYQIAGVSNSVASVTADIDVVGYYNLKGEYSTRPFNGINIVRYADGSFVKILF